MSGPSGAREATAADGSGRVVLLAGGVGGSKLAGGLQAILGERLTVIVNTADDLERHGLHVSPDHDTVMYTLAGIADTNQGWGIQGESFAAAGMLERLGEETWFRLGDRDLAVHVVRTRRLRSGERPTRIALAIQAALGVQATILPMTDADVRTEVRVDDGWIDFQEYFVHRHQAPAVHELRLKGIDAAIPTPEVERALGALGPDDRIVIGPSNPLVSIGPILAVPGLRDGIAAARARGVPVAAVSGIIGGKAVRGPADRMLSSLGHEPSALGVARLYASVADVFVLDLADRDLAVAVAGLGLRPVVLPTVMADEAGRRRLARDLLAAVG